MSFLKDNELSLSYSHACTLFEQLMKEVDGVRAPKEEYVEVLQAMYEEIERKMEAAQE